MNTQTIKKWVVRCVLILYAVFNIDSWVQVIAPNFYNNYFYKLKLYKLDSIIGGWLFFVVVAMIILHITHILKIEKKAFWILLFFFLSNLLLMYLEIKSKSE